MQINTSINKTIPKIYRQKRSIDSQTQLTQYQAFLFAKKKQNKQHIYFDSNRNVQLTFCLVQHQIRPNVF